MTTLHVFFYFIKYQHWLIYIIGSFVIAHRQCVKRYSFPSRKVYQEVGLPQSVFSRPESVAVHKLAMKTSAAIRYLNIQSHIFEDSDGLSGFLVEKIYYLIAAKQHLCENIHKSDIRPLFISTSSMQSGGMKNQYVPKFLDETIRYRWQMSRYENKFVRNKYHCLFSHSFSLWPDAARE